jgi:hypothetical protein
MSRSFSTASSPMRLSCVVLSVLFILFVLSPLISRAQDNDGPLNAAATLGERLFLETRFAEFFYTNSGGNANYQLNKGDPVLNRLENVTNTAAGPFRGLSMNCRACHLVDEMNSTLGNRTYCDFTTRSLIPQIGDGRVTTPRNSPLLVDSFLSRSVPTFLHLDGQFASIHDLVIATLTGRNYGWKPTQYATAIAHIADIIRHDDGSDALAQGKFGGGYPYSYLFNPSTDHPVSPIYRLNLQYVLGDLSITNRADPGYVTDEAIVEDITALLQVYLETLVFQQDLDGNFIGSPYDVFLIKNSLPQQPTNNETPLQYSQRLLGLITNLSAPQYVTDPADGHFTTHDQLFQFGPQELTGLKMFFTLGSASSSPARGAQVGNCVACHSPPLFTDFVFHNTGASQEEYDSIHGFGSFTRLNIPTLAERQQNYNAYLPPTTNHPNATGRFVTPPVPTDPLVADLGLWNVFANPDFPTPQPGLQQILLGLLPAPHSPVEKVAMQGPNLNINLTGGAPGWAYRIITSTNVAQPLSNWTALNTFNFPADGRFNFTNPVLPASSQVYYTFALEAAPPGDLLPQTIARFKTPTVRDLGHSQPYLHTGRKDTIEDVVQFYLQFSAIARTGAIRNSDPQMKLIFLDSTSTVVTSLSAFLRALNEDYTD